MRKRYRAPSDGFHQTGGGRSLNLYVCCSAKDGKEIEDHAQDARECQKKQKKVL